MSESGSTQFPAGPKFPGRADRTGEGSGREPNARITRVTGELREVRRVVRVRGEVVKQNRDGSVRIRTTRGEVDIKLTDRSQSPPRNGEKIELEIPPGRPPQNARATPQTTRDVRTSRPQRNENPARAASTPVSVEVQPPQLADQPVTVSPEAVRAEPRLPVEGQSVRLQPITAEEALQLVIQPLKTIVSTLRDSIDFKGQVINLEAQDFVLEQVLSIKPLNFVASEITVADIAQSLNISSDSENSQASILLSKSPEILQITNPEAGPVLGTAKIPAAMVVVQEPGLRDELKSLSQVALVQVADKIPAQNLTVEIAPAAQALIGTGIESVTRVIDSLVAKVSEFERAQIVNIQAPNMNLGIKMLDNDVNKGAEAQNTALKPSKPHIILQNHKAGEVNAVISGQTPEKLPVLSVFSVSTGRDQFFIMHAPVGEIMPGMQLTLIPQKNASVQIKAATIMSLPQAVSYILTPGTWPVIEEMYQGLAHSMPQVAQAFSNMVPSPASPSQLGPAIMFFVAAIRGGNINQWLGEKASEILRQSGRAGLMFRIAQEGQALGRIASEPLSQDWKAIALPMFWQGEISKTVLYYKRDEQGGEESQTLGKQHRFIFDLALERMGKVQLDGLFRNTRLDLIIRTQEAMSQNMQTNMRRLYMDGLKQTQISGEISFQDKPEQWVTIQAEGDGFGLSA